MNDQFYTNHEIALDLVKLIQLQPWYNKIELIIEPSAGKGSFSNLFPNCLAYDLDPKIDGIQAADFLSLTFKPRPNVLCVGNPPFGRQGSLALKFIKKCCEFADYIAFILPLSFSKQSVQRRLPLTHSLLLEHVIPKNSFHTLNNEIYSVPCIFQIWHRENRIQSVPRLKTVYFEWTTKALGEIAIRRVGFNAGTTVDGSAYEDTCEKSHYYVKSNGMPIAELKHHLNNIDWSKIASKVSGPRSISKPELIELFEASLKIESPSGHHLA